ncbi:uncharacterized protein MONBRDRAFT_28358 [Monosiga brevicollis MX1]|uniref:Uncharacterized protein n=1 Tax=Monosiga brevicollis TaxID=81824 RepID=A9V7Y1_MONBE|nr:uncharacterized protein MONBRDRAFT_28358 [Monosiga brevicollis MX1]EDQ86383.1 predicted protein [Monosiga brevicollis MX1]|eukprot:XP_001748773.1 hypothetical protein [Monosiga brevicollis MX1]
MSAPPRPAPRPRPRPRPPRPAPPPTSRIAHEDEQETALEPSPTPRVRVNHEIASPPTHQTDTYEYAAYEQDESFDQSGLNNADVQHRCEEPVVDSMTAHGDEISVQQAQDDSELRVEDETTSLHASTATAPAPAPRVSPRPRPVPAARPTPPSRPPRPVSMLSSAEPPRPSRAAPPPPKAAPPRPPPARPGPAPPRPPSVQVTNDEAGYNSTSSSSSEYEAEPEPLPAGVGTDYDHDASFDEARAEDYSYNSYNDSLASSYDAPPRPAPRPSPRHQSSESSLITDPSIDFDSDTDEEAAEIHPSTYVESMSNDPASNQPELSPEERKVGPFSLFLALPHLTHIWHLPPCFLDQQQKRLANVQEMVTTEESYVRSLSIVVDVYKPRMTTTEFNLEVPVHVVKDIFSNIDRIRNTHQRFLKVLRERVAEWEHNDTIADIYLKFAPQLSVYTHYSTNFDKASRLLDEWTKKSPLMASVLAECNALPESARLGLGAFLLEPIQRLPRFKLLLSDYIKYTPEDHPDYEPAKEALQKILNIASHVNEKIRQTENDIKIKQLERMIPSINVVKPGRMVLKEGQLMKMCRKGPQPRVVILFSDMLLYAQEQTGLVTTYVAPKTISLREMQVRAKRLPEGLYGVEVKGKQRAFYLCSEEESEQRIWVAEIQKAIEQLLASRRERSNRRGSESRPASRGSNFAVEAPIWIPDHDVSMCMVCTYEFNMIRRRHHCRSCGKVVCGSCSGHQLQLAYLSHEYGRVCDECFQKWEDIQSSKGLTVSRTSGPRRSRRDRRSIRPERLLQAAAGLSEASDVVRAGYLSEQRMLRRSQRRWYQLKTDFVLYSYKAPEDPMALASIPLPGYSIEPHQKGEGEDTEYGVKISHQNLKQHIFLADSQERAQE